MGIPGGLGDTRISLCLFSYSYDVSNTDRVKEDATYSGILIFDFTTSTNEREGRTSVRRHRLKVKGMLSRVEGKETCALGEPTILILPAPEWPIRHTSDPAQGC